MKSLIIMALLAICFNATMAQNNNQPPPTKDTTHYYYDTTFRTEVWYVTNIFTGATSTGFALRVTKNRMDFVQPTTEELKGDSFTVKKRKVPVGVMYFMPVQLLDSAATKKARKDRYKTVYEVYPADLILNDFNKNWDWMIPKPTAPKPDTGNKGTNAVVKKLK
jgi:hypothetical protein